jgi:hypothetical protein
MPLSPRQRHKLRMADRTRDAAWITTVIEDLVAANPETALFEIEQEFRDAGSQTYLIAGPGKFQVVTGGRLAMLWAVGVAGMTVEQNRAALAAKPISPP